MIKRLLVVLVLLVSAGCAPKGVVNACGQLEQLPLDHARVVSAVAKSGGSSYSFVGMFVGVPFFHQPASCRVAIEMTPVDDSLIKAQLWLPENWNGRFQGIGNGGFAGSIDTLSLNFALQRGYAAASTDTGHEASDRDGSWALHHPEKIIDYGYRAIHLTAVNAKKIISAYYGRAPAHAYFGSASNGGREALVEAQRYPEDYDGILAGAPALLPSSTLPTWGWIQQQLHAPGAYISKDKLRAIAAATVRACDAQDGVEDGVIDDPRQCRFDPAVLTCAGEENDQCLTPPQVQALRAIYAGPGAPYHGFEPGGELGDKGGWRDWFTGDKPRAAIEYVYVQEFMRYLVYSDAQWSADQFDLKRDGDAFYRQLHDILDAGDPDLSKFAARGGKLILYHGWNDGALSPRTTIDYYESVRARMGAKKAQQFITLYMVPGLQHCIGGPGPNAFGQLAPGPVADPRRNISAALEAWVEQGAAPGPIIAGKYDRDITPLLAPEKASLQRTRPLCPYPQVARWSGHGSSDDAANFSCVAPK
ncbi:MAG TPA: tannase/feruloyl esterase family alpha/beta hydrolase [Nevskiaceae bacterium]|nr:tannase/feruloyl esterase family alpha/beta hydrolase [Nevskiaceae bacterium]